MISDRCVRERRQEGERKRQRRRETVKDGARGREMERASSTLTFSLGRRQRCSHEGALDPEKPDWVKQRPKWLEEEGLVGTLEGSRRHFIL